MGGAGAPENTEKNEPNTEDLNAAEDEICEGLFGPDSDDDEDGAVDEPSQPPVEEAPATGLTDIRSAPEAEPAPAP